MLCNAPMYTVYRILLLLSLFVLTPHEVLLWVVNFMRIRRRPCPGTVDRGR